MRLVGHALDFERQENAPGKRAAAGPVEVHRHGSKTLHAIYYSFGRRERSRSAPAFDEGVDHAASDGDLGRQERQPVEVEPIGLHDLAAVDGEIAAGMLGEKGHHERAAEGPRLAGEIAKVGDVDADLLLDLAHGRLLERLAHFHEAGDGAEHAWSESRAARQQEAPIALDQDDDRRRYARIESETAIRTMSSVLAERR